MTSRGPALRITAPGGEVTHAVLDEGSVTVGRAGLDHAPAVALGPDPQRWVGRLHCTLEHADGLWSVADNASVNGTLLRSAAGVHRLDGRKRIQHGDTIMIVGDMGRDGRPLYWALTFLDPHTTQPAPFESPADVAGTGPCLRYDWVAASARRVLDGVATPVEGLRPQGHQLLRYMVGRCQGGVAVACDHAELIKALWGDPDEWPPHRSYTRNDLAGVVLATRRRIEPEPGSPRILETVTGIGYRLRVCPGGPR